MTSTTGAARTQSPTSAPVHTRGRRSRTTNPAGPLPEPFRSIRQAREFMVSSTTWDHHEHRYTGMGLHTAADMPFGGGGDRGPPSWRRPTPDTPNAPGQLAPPEDPVPAHLRLDQLVCHPARHVQSRRRPSRHLIFTGLKRGHKFRSPSNHAFPTMVATPRVSANDDCGFGIPKCAVRCRPRSRRRLGRRRSSSVIPPQIPKGSLFARA
jgi:hypothetical protein